MSPDNIEYYFIKIQNELTSECMGILIHSRIIKPINIVDNVPTGEIKSGCKFIIPSKYIPTTYLTNDHNIGPI